MIIVVHEKKSKTTPSEESILVFSAAVDKMRKVCTNSVLTYVRI